MGNNSSRASSCFCPIYIPMDPSLPFLSPSLDEGLGHAFCYVNSSSASSSSQASFSIISGASVSANTSTSLSLSSWEHFYSFPDVPSHCPAAFQSTSSFSSLPLQPLPRALPPPMASSTLGSSMAPSMGSSMVSSMGSSMGPVMGSSMGSSMGPVMNSSTVSLMGSSTLSLINPSIMPPLIPSLGSSIPPFSNPPLNSSGLLDRSLYDRCLFANPCERGFASGPLERSHLSGPIDLVDRSHFSAPISGFYHRRRTVTNMLSRVSRPVQKVISKTVSKTSAGLTRTRKSILKLSNSRKEPNLFCRSLNKPEVQWAQGKAGEDRVHIVLSESHGWLFVGIYDGFNGPDAPDFLLANLYCAIQQELQGLLWDRKDNTEGVSASTVVQHGNSEAKLPAKAAAKYSNVANLKDAARVVKLRANSRESKTLREVLSDRKNNGRETVTTSNELLPDYQTVGSPEVISQAGKENLQQFRERGGGSVSSLNELMEAASPRMDGHADTVSAVNKRDKKSREINKHGKKPRNDRSSKHRLDAELDQRSAEVHMKKESLEMDMAEGCTGKEVDHSSVLAALARALEATESAYLDMADQAIDGNPELALMGSCVLVMLMKGEDVYVMNVGDSRAVLASRPADAKCSNGLSVDQTDDDIEKINRRDAKLRSQLDQIVEDSTSDHDTLEMPHEPMTESSTLAALQLSSDHCTSVSEEVQRIQSEHPDDDKSVSKDRVKGNLKVTRAFGAGFLKHPKWNSALLEMFRVNYIGTSPYLSCKPSLCHHRLAAHDLFLVLSSDGLYQYFTNEEVVAHVECFMRRNPDGDPAQHLIEELLFRAAKKAGMDFHQLLDIPQGDRRKYHDDISVMVVSLEGRMWKSFM